MQRGKNMHCAIYRNDKDSKNRKTFVDALKKGVTLFCILINICCNFKQLSLSLTSYTVYHLCHWVAVIMSESVLKNIFVILNSIFLIKLFFHCQLQYPRTTCIRIDTIENDTLLCGTIITVI